MSIGFGVRLTVVASEGEAEAICGLLVPEDLLADARALLAAPED